ncbi:MAG: DUF554 domain-containing protein [Bulleidia sp.]
MGTLLNVIGILAGGMAGLLFGRFLLPRYQETLMMATGTAVLFVGIGGAIRHMLVYSNGAFTLQGTVMMIVSLALGAVLGEWWNLAARLERFGEWLKKKTGNGSDRQFVHAFVTSSMTVCIGAMAVVGAIEDGIHGDPSILAAKAALDFLLILVMSVSLGKGCLFSAIPVALFQGSIMVLARALKPLLTARAVTNLSLVGSVLIFCVGVNLVFQKRIRVANLLPALLVAIAWAFLPF